MAPPSRTTFSSFSSFYYPTRIQFGRDVHRFDDVINDKMNIDSITASSSSQYEEKIDATTSSTSIAAVSPSISTTRCTIRSTRRSKSSSSLYKHSLPHRRLFRRSSFHPQLPHAFAQPSTYRYTPYIPISVTRGGSSDSSLVRDGYITAAPSTTTTAYSDHDKSEEMETECDAESIIGA